MTIANSLEPLQTPIVFSHVLFSAPHKRLLAQAHQTVIPAPVPSFSACEVSDPKPVYQTSHTVRQSPQPEAEPAASRVGQYSPALCRAYAFLVGKVVLM